MSSPQPTVVPVLSAGRSRVRSSSSGRHSGLNITTLISCSDHIIDKVPDVSQSGVGEVYRILQFEDGHVILDRTPCTSDVEFSVFLCSIRFRPGDKSFRFKFIRDIMLAWKIYNWQLKWFESKIKYWWYSVFATTDSKYQVNKLRSDLKILWRRGEKYLPKIIVMSSYSNSMSPSKLFFCIQWAAVIRCLNRFYFISHHCIYS